MANFQVRKEHTAHRPRAPGQGSRTPISFDVKNELSLLSKVFTHSPDAFALLDSSFFICAANASFVSNFRVPSNRVIGRPAADVIPGWSEDLKRIFEEVRATGKPFHADAYPFASGGRLGRKVTYWNITISPVYGTDSELTGYLLLSREAANPREPLAPSPVLSAKAQHDAADVETHLAGLRDSEVQLRRLAESNIIGVISADPHRIIEANDAFLKMLGYTRHDLLSGAILWPEITPKEYLHQDQRASRELASRGVCTPYEKEFFRRDGNRVPVLLGAALLQKSPLRWVCFVVDLTDRKRAEAEHETHLAEVKQLVTASQQRASELEAILDGIADGVFVCDTEGRIIEVNDAAVRITGMSRAQYAHSQEAVLLQLLDLRHPDGRPIGKDELVLSRALSGEVIRGFEKVATNPQTHRQIHFLISAAPLKDREGRTFGAVAVLSDITSIRELDRLKDQFITVAAHELKTPVAIMKGYAQGLLRTSEDMPPSRRRMLEAINRGSDRIDSIVEDLLDISRLRVGHLELTKGRVDLPELVQEVVDRTDLTSPQHRVRVARTEPVVIHADRYRLDQVLTNLIDNAMRYSPVGGDIDVEVTVRDGQAAVSVRDYGVGIPKEKHKHIFERFYRAHTGTPFDYGGMGVGLYICKEIIARHGGKIWFESEEGKGSAFYFSLPV